jgi:hypothetical protein
MKTTTLGACASVLGYALVLAVMGPTPTVCFAGQTLCLAVACGCCMAAASAFGRGDYMRRAWALNGLSFALPIANRLTRGPEGSWFLGRVPWRAELDLALALAINGTSVVAALLFVAAFFKAGLRFAGSRGPRLFITTCAIAAASLLALPTLVPALRAATGAGHALDGEALSELISTTGDVLCFLAVIPLMHIALELRGGGLASTWWLLAGGNLGWLVYDAAVASVAGTSPGRVLIEVFLWTACVVSGLAGLAHRRAVLEASAHQVHVERVAA